MVSSALYRYYPSRDDLLTALIIDAYDSRRRSGGRAVADTRAANTVSALAVSAPAAGSSGECWVAACHAIRGWARSNPHEYALIYGSPVPGYRAPEATVGPAARVPLLFAGIVRARAAGGELGGAGEGAAAYPARSLSSASTVLRGTRAR